MNTTASLTQLARTAAAALALVLPAAAHDFWIEPASFRPLKDAKTEVRLVVGVAWKGEEVARNPERLERFVVVGPKGERPLPGLDGQMPAGILRASAEGLHTLAYHSHPAFLELEAAKFESYLKEEGLERILAERAQRGESGARSRELYERCAKSLVLVGGLAPVGYDQPVGLVLELLPKQNPFEARAEGELVVQVLFEGKPIEGLLVMALPRAKAEDAQKLRSDAHGLVKFHGIPGETWLIKAVHMQRSTEPDKADWHSWWASLTFDSNPRTPPK